MWPNPLLSSSGSSGGGYSEALGCYGNRGEFRVMDEKWWIKVFLSSPQTADEKDSQSSTGLI